MKYNGIELKEITEPGNIVFPKKMVVWDNMGLPSKEPCVRMVLALVKDNVGTTKVIASQLNKDDAGVAIWNHCAEIPEEPKPRRATNRELARWLAQGNGQIQYDDETKNFGKSPIDDSRHKALKSTTVFEYFGADDFFVIAGIKVRKWDDTEWHEFDVQYMGLET